MMVKYFFSEFGVFCLSYYNIKLNCNPTELGLLKFLQDAASGDGV